MEIIMIYLVLYYTKFYINSAFKSKHIIEKLDYIEERLNAESIRLNAESKFRKEEFSLLLNKVEGIETMFNKILERKETESASSAVSDKSISDISSNKVMTIILKSFQAEKFQNRRFKRDILQDVNKQGESMKEAFDRVENSLDNISKEIGQMKQQTLQHDIDSVKKAGRFIQRLDENAGNTNDLLNTSIQKTETILINLNGTGERIKDQVHLHNILQTQLDDMKCSGLNETRALIKNSEIILKLLTKYESCLDLYRNGFRSDGIYEIRTSHIKRDISVYCDMTTDGGGWTVFQRRQDGSEDFYRDWNDYKNGFGTFDGEFWLGNVYINLLTDDGKIHELRIDLEDYEGDQAYAKYNKFKIGPEKTNYKLEVSGYTGNAGDSLEYHNGMQFSTKERDNDLSSYNCASEYNGAWWFNSCYRSHLNGVYNKQKECTSWTLCIIWYKWGYFYHNMKFTEMKLR